MPLDDLQGESHFSGVIWNDTTFCPNANLKWRVGTQASSCFRKTHISKLKTIMSGRGLTIDTSGVINLSYSFVDNPYLEEIPIISAEGLKSFAAISNSFATNPILKSIDNIILPNTYSATVSSEVVMFKACPLLTDVTFAGVIPWSLNVSGAPLSPDSMKSIISCLKDYRNEPTNLDVYTITFKTDCWTALEADAEKPPEGNTWQEYVRLLGWKIGTA
jgi:hypothetical protein